MVAVNFRLRSMPPTPASYYNWVFFPTPTVQTSTQSTSTVSTDNTHNSICFSPQQLSEFIDKMGNTHNHYESPVSKTPIEEEEGGFHMLEIHAPTAGAAAGGIILTLVISFLVLYCCLKYRKGLARRIQTAANQQAPPQQLPVYNPPAPIQHIYQSLPPPPSIPIPPPPPSSAYATYMSPPMSPIPLPPSMSPTHAAAIPLPAQLPVTSYPMLTYKVPDGV